MYSVINYRDNAIVISLSVILINSSLIVPTFAFTLRNLFPLAPPTEFWIGEVGMCVVLLGFKLLGYKLGCV